MDIRSKRRVGAGPGGGASGLTRGKDVPGEPPRRSPPDARTPTIPNRPALLAAAGAALAVAAVAAPSAQAASPAWQCRASALSASVAAQPAIEPVLAGGGGTCADAKAGFPALPQSLAIPASLLTAGTVSAQTTVDPDTGGTAAQRVSAVGQVEDLALRLGPLGTVALGARVAVARAAAACVAGRPRLDGASELLCGVTLNGSSVTADQLAQRLADLLRPIGQIVDVRVNEQVRDASGLTQRALHVKVLTLVGGASVLDLVVGDARVGSAGAVCSGSGSDGPGGDGSGSGSGPGGPDGSGTLPGGTCACPAGAILDATSGFCVIRGGVAGAMATGGQDIVVGRPFDGPSGGRVVSIAEARKRFPASRCVRGGGPAFAVIGTKRADHVTGTNRRDRILTLGGKDRADGGRGADCIDGGTARDALAGGSGRDRVYGSSGNDALNGGPDTDLLDGGRGNDSINAAFGKDRVVGGPGRDVERRHGRAPGPGRVRQGDRHGPRQRQRAAPHERVRAPLLPAGSQPAQLAPPPGRSPARGRPPARRSDLAALPAALALPPPRLGVDLGRRRRLATEPRAARAGLLLDAVLAREAVDRAQHRAVAEQEQHDESEDHAARDDEPVDGQHGRERHRRTQQHQRRARAATPTASSGRAAAPAGTGRHRALRDRAPPRSPRPRRGTDRVRGGGAARERRAPCAVDRSRCPARKHPLRALAPAPAAAAAHRRRPRARAEPGRAACT